MDLESYLTGYVQACVNHRDVLEMTEEDARQFVLQCAMEAKDSWDLLQQTVNEQN